MAIVQISKIQHRSGNLVDLPQLDQAELGWANDAKLLFIGKSDPNENIEVLTSYSNISFSQLEGGVGNLNINANSISNGQVLTYDGNNWVNRGGNAGGLITLGDVNDVKITGGSIGYTLETDGIGNLSWTPKATIVAMIANIAVIDVPNTAVSATTSGTNIITVSDSTNFPANTAVSFSNTFGNLTANTTYYVKDVVSSTQITVSDVIGNANLTLTSSSGSYTMSIVETLVTTTEENFFTERALVTITDVVGMTELNGKNFYADIKTSNTFSLYLDSALQIPVNAIEYTSYVSGGRVISSAGGGGGAITIGGSNRSVQFNYNSLLDGVADFTYNVDTATLTVNGNANVGNLNSAGLVKSDTLSSVTVVSPPISVNSTLRVANLNVSYSNVSDYEVVTTKNTGTFYPVFVTGNTTANYALGSNANLFFNALTGELGTTLLTGALTTSAQPNITSVGTLTGLSINGNITGNLLPSANVTYNLGANTQRWNNLYLSGTTIYLGNSTITESSNTISIANLNVTTFANIVNGNVTGSLNIVGNANVGNLGTSGQVIAIGNVTGGNLKTAGILSVTGNANVGNLGTTNITATLLTGTLTTASQPNITSVGTLTSLSVTGNVSGANLTGTHYGAATGLTSIPAGNITGTVANATYAISAGSATTAGTVTTAAQPNITSVGTLSAATVTSNVTAGGIKTDNYYYANGVSISFAGTYSNSNVAAYMPTYEGNVGLSGGNAVFNGKTITTGANTTAGTITGNWSLSAGSQLRATYADLAEYYTADAQYPPGTVLEFGGEFEVTLATEQSRTLAGVVSTDPAYVMNSACPGEFIAAVALQGRVPCKVKGPTRKGDMLISDGNGYARSCTNPTVGSVIGKALETFNGIEGVVEVAIGRL